MTTPVEAALAAFYPGQTIHEANKASLMKRMTAALTAGLPKPVQKMKASWVDEASRIYGYSLGCDNNQQAVAAALEQIDQLLKQGGAMAVGMKYLDLTGTYRLMAVLLTAQEEP